MFHHKPAKTGYSCVAHPLTSNPGVESATKRFQNTLPIAGRRRVAPGISPAGLPADRSRFSTAHAPQAPRRIHCVASSTEAHPSSQRVAARADWLSARCSYTQPTLPHMSNRVSLSGVGVLEMPVFCDLEYSAKWAEPTSYWLCPRFVSESISAAGLGNTLVISSRHSECLGIIVGWRRKCFHNGRGIAKTKLQQAISLFCLDIDVSSALSHGVSIRSHKNIGTSLRISGCLESIT